MFLLFNVGGNVQMLIMEFVEPEKIFVNKYFGSAYGHDHSRSQVFYHINSLRGFGMILLNWWVANIPRH